ncbi:aminodeoxychorismate/anthranilate synthase component II [Leptospira sp. 96542]|nr:aminodeoxychorismate/anthranilate synthase component II [Leptospira sp. 96542]
MLLLIDNYDSFTYILYQYLNQIMPTKLIQNDESLPNDLAEVYKGIVLSPGPGLPETSGNLIKYTKQCYAKFPILGVCLGHQTLAEIFGAKLEKTKEIYHGRTSKIKHNGEGIFQGIPDLFLANRYHSWVVSETNLPQEIEVTARTEDGLIMGIRHKQFRNVFGVQFHPESILTEYGKKLVQNFCEVVSV